ncbi:MAG: hypothetical protein C0410_03745 [Anaerolinea sp.]|nr:hypothetical protein [Anaerolinea sp.]
MKADSLPFNLQHPTPEDLDRVFEFLIAFDIAEYGEEDSDKDDLTDQWSEADLANDAWISQDDEGRLTGYAILSEEYDHKRFLDVYALPLITPKALTETLYELGVERFQTLIKEGKSAANCTLTTFANGYNEAMCAVIQAHGFAVEKYHYRMQINFTEPFASPAFPSEYTLSKFTQGDEKELYELIISTFDWQGAHILPFEDWSKDIFRNGRFDPELFIMLRRDQKLVGAAICYDEESRIWLKELAVSKDLQGKGIGSLLLKQVFALAGQKSIPTVSLGVAAANEKAGAFYQRNGMSCTRKFVQFQRPA